ncbi:NrfD/PsrC family molybdoenzyme membrane anchor subunit [Candidatus Magnetomonas plexicatena]|uniref:NrfD/PsrC family molybdoenzyme membrane anchor subunit n=1 Tax=Candidatus Magnetomonas plexicatena TaxID=2552947 RepID=UPI001C76E954|nr:polysulfide reductase NrfD [Nitrospirales bacterium LBB_01]
MNHIYWNYIIAFYLFTAGISAGAVLVGSIAKFIDSGKYRLTIKTAALTAPFPIMVGMLGLVYDLEKPMYFWRLFTVFEITSVMSVGAWIIFLFSIICGINFIAELPDKYDFLKLRNLFKSPSVKNLLNVSGFVLAFSTATYTGVLLCCLSARPFWNSPMLPLMFMFSAVIDGIAVIRLIALFSKPDEVKQNNHLLHIMDMVLVPFLALSIILFLFGLYNSTDYARSSVSLVLSGELRISFFAGVLLIGIIVPVLFGIYEFFSGYKLSVNLKIVVLLSTLIGGYMLRYVVIYAGQIADAVF